MATLPLDVDGVLSEVKNGDGGKVEQQAGLPAETVLGHVHLKVADIARAEAFYTGVLGFQLTTRYGSSAAFVSAGGYHHHIGLNVWESAGAPPPPPGSAGLRDFSVILPDEMELERVIERVRSAGLQAEEQDHGYLVRDPAQNGVLLSSR
jgi:catechol 2,3-dioxygenase